MKKIILAALFFALGMTVSVGPAHAYDKNKMYGASYKCGMTLSTGVARKTWDEMNRTEQDWIMCSQYRNWESMTMSQRESAELVMKDRWKEMATGEKEDMIKAAQNSAWSAEERHSMGPFQRSLEDLADYR